MMKPRSSYALAAVVLLALTLIAFAVGRYPVSVSEMLSLIIGLPPSVGMDWRARWGRWLNPRPRRTRSRPR